MPVDITETITIEVRETGCNPIYLGWLNSLGGRDYWLFEHNQLDRNEYSTIGTFEPPTTDLETAEGIKRVLGRTNFNTLGVFAGGLTRNQYDAIREVLQSPDVEQIFTDATKIKVIPVTNSVSTQTKSNGHEIQFDIEYPEIFAQVE